MKNSLPAKDGIILVAIVIAPYFALSAIDWIISLIN